jgi:hypothetical protein
VAFVQIMSYNTTQRAEMDAAIEQWKADTQDVRRSRRRLLLKDRDEPDRFVEVIFFDSYEDAMHNSRLPATNALSSTFASLITDAFEFQNLDVVAEDL